MTILHDDADLEDANTDFEDTDITDEEPEDGANTDQPQKTAEEKREELKRSFIADIKSGKKTLDDIPPNFGWLKPDIEKGLKDTKPEVKEDELELKIRNVLTEREAKQEFEFLVEDLQDANISEEQEAQLREEYESLLSEFKNPTESQKLKSLMIARRLAGLKDTSSELRDRRRKGMSLPPLGGRKRSTVQKDSMTEIEKRLSGGLPPGFQT